MKFAVVAGGWHWPMHFYEEIAHQAHGVDLFVVSHRNPELGIVRQEKVRGLILAPGPLGNLDRIMYAKHTTLKGLKALGWHYMEAPNICGDQCFLNQWLEKHDYRTYDAILNCHDDVYIRRQDLFERASQGNWLILANGHNAIEPEYYFRGSFEFWRREMLEMLGGKIDLGQIPLTREGITYSPKNRKALSPWNKTRIPLRTFLAQNNLSNRIERLSPYYRVSPWVIEGERGFLHKQAPAPEWQITAGLAAYPL
jgi:hypothetical protein